MAETLTTSGDENHSCPIGIDALRRRVEDLSQMRTSLLRSSETVGPEFPQLVQECFADLQSRSKQIDEEEPSLSALGLEELEAYVDCLKKELNAVNEESKAVSDEVGSLMRRAEHESSRLELDLLWLENTLRQIDSQESSDCKDREHVDGLSVVENASMDHHFKKMEIDNLIERTTAYINSLEDIQYEFERHEVISQIEDKISGIEVMDFEGNCIRLNLKTCIKPVEGLLQKFDTAIEISSFDHELLIEVTDGNILKTLRVFPADVFLDDIIDNAKSLRYSLQRVICRVQQKIYLCTLRRLLCKIANASHSIEYLDKDETILAHLVGGIDAHIKISQGWPILSCGLQLISIKSSSNEISLSLLCRIKEMANSLEIAVRWDLVRFVGTLETILLQEMQAAIGRKLY